MKEVLQDNETTPVEHKSLPREKAGLLSKARTNRWTSCKAYLHKINKSTSIKCSTCPERDDTTKHQLNVCMDHEEKRQILLAKLNHKYTKITNMLMTTDTKELQLLTDFLKEIHADKQETLKKDPSRYYSSKPTNLRRANQIDASTQTEDDHQPT